MRLSGGLGAARKQLGGQQGVGLRVQKRQQIELLKDDAHSFTTKLIPRHGAECRQVMSQDLTNTLLHLLHPRQQ